MSKEIKPCPFCGGEADTEWHHGYWGVKCNECYAEVSANGMNDAIEAWNTRKPMDDIVGQLEGCSWWTESSYDEDGYYNDDSINVVDLDDAIEIVKKGGQE